MLEKWTLKKIFPHYEDLPLKAYSILADFSSHGFIISQKIREKRGLPIMNKLYDSGIFDFSFKEFGKIP